MNNNNRGNNRRRGRGNNNNNNRPQGGGYGGQQVNRIDSRARGNAPQLLEKYRKLAQDAHMNGDRVTSEYFLQFADHYFRVIADQRNRQEEQRLRRDERWQGDGDQPDEGDDGEFGGDGDFPAFDQPPVYTRRDRDAGDRPAEPQEYRANGAAPEPRRDADAAPAGEQGAEEAAEEAPREAYEPEANPFVRDSRSRGLRPRREDRGPRRDEAPAVEAAPVETDADIPGFDPASLPPAIAREGGAREGGAREEEPAPRRRARRRPSADDTGEALQTAG